MTSNGTINLTPLKPFSDYLTEHVLTDLKTTSTKHYTIFREQRHYEFSVATVTFSGRYVGEITLIEESDGVDAIYFFGELPWYLNPITGDHGVILAWNRQYGRLDKHETVPFVEAA